MWTNENGTRPCSRSCKRWATRVVSFVSRRLYSSLLTFSVAFLAIVPSAGIGESQPLPVKAPKPKRVLIMAWRTQSPKLADLTGEPMVIPFPKPTELTWDYPLPLPRDVVFDVLHSLSIEGPWQKIGETNQPPWRVQADKQSGFFRIETRNVHIATEQTTNTRNL